MSMSKKLIYINTAPKVNHKTDGSVFYTVLVGLSKQTLAEAGVGHVDTLTMQVFENQLENLTKAFKACKKTGAKLALACDEIVITEPKENTYVSKAGETITQMQASCWADGPSELTIVKRTLTISDDLRALLEGDDDDDFEL